MDGDIKLSQSTAILRYIGEKYEMNGKDIQQKALVDMVLAEAMDMILRVVPVAYSSEFDNKLPELLEKEPYYFKRLEAFLKGKKWFAGDDLTICDFPMWNVLEIFTLFEPTYLDDFPLLKDFLKRFESLPAIESYMKSDEFIHWPVFGGVSIGFQKKKTFDKVTDLKLTADKVISLHHFTCPTYCVGISI